jgi:hypothetical protein
MWVPKSKWSIWCIMYHFCSMRLGFCWLTIFIRYFRGLTLFSTTNVVVLWYEPSIYGVPNVHQGKHTDSPKQEIWHNLQQRSLYRIQQLTTDHIVRQCTYISKADPDISITVVLGYPPVGSSRINIWVCLLNKCEISNSYCRAMTRFGIRPNDVTTGDF